MSASIITRKGQVTIPKEIRDHLKIKEGERVLFLLRGQEVHLRVLHGTILDLKNSVKPKKRPEDFDRVRQTVRRAVSRKVAAGD